MNETRYSALRTQHSGLSTRNLAAPAALLGSSIGAFAALKSLGEIPPWAVKLIETQAVGMLGFLVLLGCVIYFAPKLIGALAQQAVAMQKVGDQLQVMTGQAGKLDEISSKIDEIKFDSGIFADRLTRIEEHLINAQRQDDL